MSQLVADFTNLILQMLVYLHGFTGNYGWDIILLTLIVRLVMFPLTLSSLRGMKAMQAVQPRMKELQEKYKDDKERQTREIMALYKEAGANPMSSCLPMLLQMPIFIVLYRVLSLPELNGYILVNESFYGMNLTSAAFTKLSPDFLKDITLVLPGMVNLDFLGFSYFNGAYLYTPVLIVVALMAVTTIVQQKMMTVDPQQQSTMWMMNIMIVWFSFMMPAGVLLYWGVSNVLQLIQQAAMKTPKIAEKMAAPKGKAAPAGGGADKPKSAQKAVASGSSEKSKKETPANKTAAEKKPAAGESAIDPKEGKGGSVKRNYPAKNTGSGKKNKKKK